MLMVLWGGAIGVGIWTVQSPSHPVTNEVDVLFPNICLEPSYDGRRVAASWIAALVFDSTIFGLTMVKAFTARAVENQGSRLLTRMTRDGAMYYIVLGIVYLSNIITSFVAPPALQDISVWFTNVISGTLMSRLLLNLRSCAVDETASVDPGITNGLSFLSISFADVSESEEVQ